ncbi:MAG: type II toxin-antitoxin system RelE/ParE family toxin [Polyangiaceae bacterium]|nr:type II toxin-antitoxin system RelE/ParE family toxin [Polyangiaceae bacterium]
MPKYRVDVAPAATRAIDALDGSIRPRVIRKIMGLKEEPRPAGCKKLAGSDNLWRIRMGSYRIVYTIEDAEVLVLVTRVAHRREVYR